MSKFINPFTDFGFKKLFGTEDSKPLLLDFLNSILPNISIVDLNFKDKEHLGKNEFERKAIFDLFCDTEDGEKFIVEMQKAKQKYFKDRSLFYSSFPIQEQAPQGEWDFELKAVYCVGILDFKFNEKISDDENELQSLNDVIHYVELKNHRNEVFYKKLKFVYIELPNFNKTLEELETQQDKWLFFLKHLANLNDIPQLFKGSIFEQGFSNAAFYNLNSAERDAYEQSLKIYRDLKNVIDYAEEKGELTGHQKGKVEGEIIGIKKGKIVGKIEKSIEIGLKRLQRGDDLKFIQEDLDFTDTQMEILIKGCKNKLNFDDIIKELMNKSS